MQTRQALLLITFITVLTASHASSNPTISKKVDTVNIQFDVKRVESPAVLQYAKHPLTWRAYLPACPPGSHPIDGVDPTMVQLDYPPNYPYCNCICNGNCGGLKGITAPSGQQQQPVYTATVTCAANVQGWFENIMQKITPTPHQYSYCQSGACTTNPLPADLSYAVPTGGQANTIKIDFVACQVAAVSGCGTPDPISLSRQ